MRVIIKKSYLSGEVNVPPSKSYAHRLLIGAALCSGESRIRNLELSQDLLATIDSLKSLGADIQIKGKTTIVRGFGDRPRTGAVLKCRESGSTLRFLIPVALLGGSAMFFGSERLIARGVEVYKEIFRGRSTQINSGVTTVKVSRSIESGDYFVRGDVSSQFITGLMFALPLLQGDSSITVFEPFESRSYVDITIEVLKKFGIIIEQTSENSFKIPGGQAYAHVEERIEGDWSNAAFFHALNALGNDIKIKGLKKSSTQGDSVCVQYFKKLEQNSVLDMSNCPDLAPITFAVAAAKEGAVFTGTHRLALKESSRAEAMAEEIAKFGGSLKVESDQTTVYKKELRKPFRILSSHNDHRIVMSLAVLATLFGGVIDGAEAVEKSFPDFFKILESLGAEIEYS